MVGGDLGKGALGETGPEGERGVLKTQEVRMTRNENVGGAGSPPSPLRREGPLLSSAWTEQ